MPVRNTPLSLYRRPQVSLARSTTLRMWLVSACAGLAVVQSSLTDDGASLMIAFAALSGAVLSEFLLNVKLHSQNIADGSAAASALIFTLLLPNTFPPVLAFLGSIFAMTVVKHSFGGLGANWLNPAVGAWLFARFSWPAAFEESLRNSPLSLLSTLSRNGGLDPQGSPLSLLAANGMDLSGAFSLPGAASPAGFGAVFGNGAEGVAAFLNRTVFSFLGTRLPAEYAALFAPRFPAIIADRGLLCLLAGTIVIVAFQAGETWIPAVFLIVYAFLVRLFGAFFLGGALGNGDILFGICSGGVIVAVFLLSSDPATAPKSRGGKAAAVVLAAVLAFMFRYLAFEPYGAFFAIALVNILVLLIRGVENRFLYQKAGGL
ncbi:MAG: RnfABCDGE type electron transport complex subunit D [Treponema sp.]|nr:RnfABCDGE type electron transport complex subunit D [Treponema sp.]